MPRCNGTAKPIVINKNILTFRTVRNYFKKVEIFMDTPLVKFTYRFVSDFCLSFRFARLFLKYFCESRNYLNIVP